MPRSSTGRRSMLPLANLIVRLGGLTAVLLALALCAVIELEVNGHPMVPQARQRDPVARPQSTAKVPGRAATTPLIRQVRAAASEQHAALVRKAFGVQNVPRPDVHLVRVDQTGGWAFGTCAIPPPAGVDAMPQSALFVARRSGGSWRVALAGTTAFARLVRQAPTTLIPADQRPSLERYGKVTARDGKAVGRNGNAPAGLALPWRKGESWTMRSMAGLSGLQFTGGDGRVLASGTGRLYRVCARSPGRGMLLLIHPNGMASEFYQVADITDVKDGTLVARGEYLGRISTDRPCGGPSAKGRAASFTLRTGDGAVLLDGARIGGWTLHTAKGRFYADHSGVRVDSGNPLLNFGPYRADPS